ncbi:MAG: SDR family oxidoreductase [Actinobacteria bacterium]|nr:SDR family oxidoreductase [Actinomycetota bacterium]
MQLTNRNALVTGGAHRIGGAISRALAEAGVNVFVHYGRSEAAAEELAAELRSLGVRSAIGDADLSDPRTARNLMDVATEAIGPVSILINSASGFPFDTLEDLTLDALRATMALSLESPVMLMQAMADQYEGTDGAIVNIADVRTLTPYKKHFSYTIAKGAIDTATRAAAVALAPNIRVNAVALGVILAPPGEDADYVEGLASNLPLGRAGGVEPVTQAVLHLIENDFVTGEIVRLDGGAHLA